MDLVARVKTVFLLPVQGLKSCWAMVLLLHSSNALKSYRCLSCCGVVERKLRTRPRVGEKTDGHHARVSIVELIIVWCWLYLLCRALTVLASRENLGSMLHVVRDIGCVRPPLAFHVEQNASHGRVNTGVAIVLPCRLL